MDQLVTQSAHAMAKAGVTAEDFLEALPEIRAKVRREIYDEEYLREIERRAAYERSGGGRLRDAGASGLGHLHQHGPLRTVSDGAPLAFLEDVARIYVGRAAN